MRFPFPSRSSRGIPSLAVRGLAVALLVGCAGGSGDSGPRPADAARGWNVLLVSLDTVRADRLGAWGYDLRPVSPAIDSLVARGVRFDRAMAPRAITWPALASALTGPYPTGHGVIQNGYDLPADLPTLPVLLQEQGYQTGAFLSNVCKVDLPPSFVPVPMLEQR